MIAAVGIIRGTLQDLGYEVVGIDVGTGDNTVIVVARPSQTDTMKTESVVDLYYEDEEAAVSAAEEEPERFPAREKPDGESSESDPPPESSVVVPPHRNWHATFL